MTSEEKVQPHEPMIPSINNYNYCFGIERTDDNHQNRLFDNYNYNYNITHANIERERENPLHSLKVKTIASLEEVS